MRLHGGGAWLWTMTEVVAHVIESVIHTMVAPINEVGGVNRQRRGIFTIVIMLPIVIGTLLG